MPSVSRPDRAFQTGSSKLPVPVPSASPQFGSSSSSHFGRSQRFPSDADGFTTPDYDHGTAIQDHNNDSDDIGSEPSEGSFGSFGSIGLKFHGSFRVHVPSQTIHSAPDAAESSLPVLQSISSNDASPIVHDEEFNRPFQHPVNGLRLHPRFYFYLSCNNRITSFNERM